MHVGDSGGSNCYVMGGGFSGAVGKNPQGKKQSWAWPKIKNLLGKSPFGGPR